MKKKPSVTFPPTSIRIDPELAYRARQLALKNKRDGSPDDTFSKIVNTAVLEYLKKRRA